MDAASVKYRIELTKTGPAAFLGHLEFTNVIRRACRRAGLPLKYSEGYHPHAKMSFGKALPVGIESDCEHCDVELLQDVACEDIMTKLDGSFPEGIRIVSATKLDKGAPSIERSVAATSYNIEGNLDPAGISRFNSEKSRMFARQRGERTVNIELKDYIARLVAEGEGVVGLTLVEREPALRIFEVVSEIFDLKEEELEGLRIRKTICQMN